ncbi:MAG: Rrf2 family transcriptional regulator [Myxococcota bacterium]
MLLTQTAEYALRAMATLTALPPAEALQAREIAARSGVPVPYLSKILRRLVLDGLLLSRKGHGGGFTLAKAPGDIRFAEVLAAADFVPGDDHCAFGWGSCDGQNPCPLHPAWSRAKSDFVRWAEETTLADVGVGNFPGR